MGDRLGIRNVVDFCSFWIGYSSFNAVHSLNQDSMVGFSTTHCLIDQANTCLIHFYKRCVSIESRLCVCFFFRAKESLLNKMCKNFTVIYIVGIIECVKCFFFCFLSQRLIDTELIAFDKCLRPYHVESTSSRPITEVKQHWVALVLGWVTAWEYAML